MKALSWSGTFLLVHCMHRFNDFYLTVTVNSYTDVFRLGSGAWHSLASFVVTIYTYGRTLYPTGIYLSPSTDVTIFTYGLILLSLIGIWLTYMISFQNMQFLYEYQNEWQQRQLKLPNTYLMDLARKWKIKQIHKLPLKKARDWLER